MIQTLSKFLSKECNKENVNHILIIIFIIIVVATMFYIGYHKNNKHIGTEGRSDGNDGNDEIYIEGFKNNLKNLVDGGKSQRLEHFNKKSKGRSKFTKLIDRFNRIDEHFFDPDDHSMKHMKHKITEYYRSFDKEKFSNTPKNSRHALDKFKHFKESFWNIFKD